tara:strand:- start:550 stop:789 length:240 start_codon:yes stop_codon:yes gene_type:complete
MKGRNKKNIELIRQFLEEKQRASTHEIYDWMNENTHWGVTLRQLTNVLCKTKSKFAKVGRVEVKTMLNNTAEITIWRNV